MRLFSLALTVALFGSVAAQAAPVTFFGQDNNPGSSTANSTAARNGFLANLTGGVGTENFESFSGGASAPIALNFPGSAGSITATLTGDGQIRNAPANGRFATSGTHYYEVSGAFTIAFSSAISAFGFYGTDIGDFDGDLVLNLVGGGTQKITLPTHGSNDGSLLYFGFYDLANAYTSISFTNTAPGVDYFGFDDMTIGDLKQVTPVPEPASLALLGAGLGGLLVARRRKKA